MVFRANGDEKKISPSTFVILLSLGSLQLQLWLIFLVELFWLIFLVELFLDKKDRNVGACVPKRKDDDNWYAQFKTAQKVLKQYMMAKERLLTSL